MSFDASSLPESAISLAELQFRRLGRLDGMFPYLHQKPYNRFNMCRLRDGTTSLTGP